MLKLPIVNVYNSKRKIYLFIRTEENKLKIKTDNDFHPYFFEPSSDGKYKGYDGTPLKKVITTTPSEVPELRSDDSYESDIKFTQRYIIDKIGEFTKTPIKYFLIDIEVKNPKSEFPEPKSAKYPVSSITIYNSKFNKIRNWFLGDYKKTHKNTKLAEIHLFKDFIEYMRKAKPDLLIGYYMYGFDYPYLYNRFSQLPQKYFFEKSSQYNNFAVAISPIRRVRGSCIREHNIFFPAGMSIIDYLPWLKKIPKWRSSKSFALNYIMEKHLGKGKEYQDVDFSKLDITVKYRNIGDIKGLKELEQKVFKLIPYYDELRRFAKVQWEDLEYNSRIIESLILQEAKKKKVRLPMKRDNVEKEEFEGAFREAFETGAFWNLAKFDLGSAYPMSIINLCLDPANITKRTKSKYQIVEVEGTRFKQNPNALLPKVVKDLVEMKSKLKKELKTLNPESNEYKELEFKYDAIKCVVNSAYGVMGNRFFRLYDKRIAEGVTKTVKTLLQDTIKYVENELGLKVIYADTDSIFINTKDDISNTLNNFVKKWGKKRFGIDNFSIDFDYEGYFERILILAKCRYKGWLRTKTGLKEEIKGVEVKRKDSTKFMAKFQDEIIENIMNKSSKNEIVDKINDAIEKIKSGKIPLQDIAFPCKLAKNPDTYKNVPIFLRALRYTQDILPNFNKRLGELFYYIYVNATKVDVKVKTELHYEGYPKHVIEGDLSKAQVIEELKNNACTGCEYGAISNFDEKKLRVLHKKTKKAHNVLAFDEENKEHIHLDEIDWKKMIDRNIMNKMQVIFEAMKWDLIGINFK